MILLGSRIARGARRSRCSVSSPRRPNTRRLFRWATCAAVILLAGALPNCHRSASAEELPAAAHFRAKVQPLLENYCYGCHGYGASEGNRTLDEFESDAAMLADRDLWRAVLMNLRAGIMPPAGEERPTDQERAEILDWIKQGAFGIDPSDPDPGRVTLRRLNRVEYRNTIRDLMGIDFNTSEHFPPDDAGYGFDNIGDVLSVSPMLLEKYFEAAETIVETAVPRVSKVMPTRQIAGRAFQSDGNGPRGDALDFYEAAEVEHTARVDQEGQYRVVVEAEVGGTFDFDPGRCRVTFEIDGEAKFAEEYGWANNVKKNHTFDVSWPAGAHRLAFRLEPIKSDKPRAEGITYRLRRVKIEGPLDERHWKEPPGYRRFFPKGPAPEEPAARDAYARELLATFASRAFRRPADEPTVERLAAIARETFEQSGETFETGVAQAMVAALASPRFLFRVEGIEELADGERFPRVDEHALAARLSYFLWSTMPDGELRRLADRSELRANLRPQVERMLADRRSRSLVTDFAGQWLRSRDVEHVSIDPGAALGLAEENQRLRRTQRSLRQNERQQAGAEAQLERLTRELQAATAEDDEAAEPRAEEESQRQNESNDAQSRQRRRELRTLERRAEQQRARIAQLNEEAGTLRADLKLAQAEIDRLGRQRDAFNRSLRRAMREETEACFEYVMREDRSLLELIDSDYTFLNEELARFYGIPGVRGNEMRRVKLPPGSARGGLLTQGTTLVVTSNPSRTSPVKRGLFVLENILGSPPPPPPADVPELEQAAAAFEGGEPTGRELIELHRRDPLCHACHSRMDPLGLALENFNALGMWRDTEHGRPIDPLGELLTGEEFDSIGQLKQVLSEGHRFDFYRCAAEKTLTFALGRGLEYYDEHTVDEIAERLEREGGKFSTLVFSVVESAPFQKRRPTDENAAREE